MRRTVCILFIRQSLPSEVYNLSYETHVKKSQRTKKKAKRQIDMKGFVSLFRSFFFFTGFLIEIPEESKKLLVTARSEQVCLSVRLLQNGMGSADIYIGNSRTRY